MSTSSTSFVIPAQPATTLTIIGDRLKGTIEICYSVIDADDMIYFSNFEHAIFYVRNVNKVVQFLS